MDVSLIGRPLYQWLIALAATLLLIATLTLLRWWLANRILLGAPEGSLRALVRNGNARWLRATTLMLGICLGAILLDPPSRGLQAVRIALVVTLGLQAALLLPVLIDWLLVRFLPRPAFPDGNGAAPDDRPATSILATLAGVRWLVLLAAYSVLLLLTLQNVGVDVTAMVASLGIGGIAIALAVQNILGDLFASLTISLDRPFTRGDFIVVGSEMGEVEHVGLKTTRVRSLSGEELVFGNSDLLQSRIRNYKRMAQRRVVFQLRVPLWTSIEQLESIPTIVRSAVAGRPELRFDRSHLAELGDSSFNVESVYIVGSADFNLHMDALQAVLLAILREFGARGIELATPVRTIHVPGLEAPGGADIEPPR